MNSLKKEKLTTIIMLIIGVFFFFLLGNKGYVLLKDSEIYTEGYYGTTVMPLYILFIQTLKSIFSGELYLYVAVFIQGLTAILTSLILANYLYKTFRLGQWQRVIVYLLSFLPYAYSLPQEVVTHEIMTESMAFSLFYIYFILFYNSIINLKWSQMIVVLGISILLTGFRIQLMLLIPIAGIGFIIIYIGQKRIPKKRVLYIVLPILLFCIIIFSVVRQSYSRRQFNFLDGTQIADALLGRAIYISEQSDVDLFQDEDLKEAFTVLYNYADKEEMRYAYINEQDGLRWHHIINGVNYTTRSSWENLVKFCELKGYDYTVSEQFQTDIMIPIIFEHFEDMCSNFMELTAASMMAGIFLQKDSIYTLCIFVTIFLYLFGIMIAILNRKEKLTVIFYLLTMLILLFNIMLLNILFYGLQRYVVYTYGLYYISLFLMLRDLWNKIKNGGQ